MKNDAMDTDASQGPEEAWGQALRRFDRELQRRGAAERTRHAYGADCGELAQWAAAQRLRPHEVGYPVLRRWAARASHSGRRAAHASRARWRPRAPSSACSSSTASCAPTRPTCSPRPAPPLPRTLKPHEVARLLDRIPPPRRWSCATARCSRSPTAAACARRRSSTSTCARSSSTPSSCACSAKAPRRASCRSGSPPCAPWRAIWSAAARPGGRVGGARAVPLQDRPAALDLGHPPPSAGLGAPCRAQGAVHPHALRTHTRPTCWRAVPICARSRSCWATLHLHNPGLHSGRVSAPTGRV